MKKLLRHSDKFLTFGDQALVSGGSFLLNILLARWLGIEIFGYFTLYWMGILLLNNFNQAFITQPLLTLSAKAENKSTYEKGVLLLQWTSLIPYGLLLWIITLFASHLLPPASIVNSHIPFIVLALLYQINEYIRKLFFARSSYKNAFILDALTVTLQFGGISFCYFFSKLSLDIAIWMMAIGYLPALVTMVIETRMIEAIAYKETLLRHWRFSSWLLATSLVQWFSGNYVFLIAGSIIGAAAVGILKIGQSMVGAITIFFQVVENYLPPRAAALYKDKGTKALWQYLFGIMRQLGVGFVIMAAGIAVFARPVSAYIFGPEAAAEYTVFQGFAMLVVILFPGFIFRIGIRSMERNRHIFWAYVLNVLTSVLLAHWMVSQWSLYGAVGVLMLSQLVMIIWYVWFIIKIQRDENYSYSAR